MTGPYFVDTNVIVYARDRSEDRKQQAANDWLEYLWTAGEGRLSTQVLQEFYNVVTRKLANPVDRSLARADVLRLLAWDPIAPDAHIFQFAFAIEDRYQLSWWDSLIVAAAMQQGCSDLISEDLQDGQDFDGVRVLDPFANPPTSVPR